MITKSETGKRRAEPPWQNGSRMLYLRSADEFFNKYPKATVHDWLHMGQKETGDSEWRISVDRQNEGIKSFGDFLFESIESAKTLFYASNIKKENFPNEPLLMRRKSKNAPAKMPATSRLNNYVYAYNGDVRLFSASLEDAQALIDAGLFVKQPASKIVAKLNDHFKYWSAPLYSPPIDGFAPPGMKKSEWLKKFSEIYDGWTWSTEYKFVVLLPEFVKKNFNLVGGSQKWSKAGDVEIPKNILDVVRRFSNISGRKLSVDTIDWMRKHGPKPDGKVTLYKGMIFKTKGHADLALSSHGVEQFAKAGTTINLDVYSASSWSTEKEVAQDFSKSNGLFGVLVSGEFEPEHILFDSTKLSPKTKEKLPFSGQNEVIVDVGVYKVDIIKAGYTRKEA